MNSGSMHSARTAQAGLLPVGGSILDAVTPPEFVQAFVQFAADRFKQVFDVLRGNIDLDALPLLQGVGPLPN